MCTDEYRTIALFDFTFRGIVRMHTIMLMNEEIPYTTRQSKKARRMRMTFPLGRALEVTLPKGCPNESMLSFLMHKKERIVEKHRSRQRVFNDHLIADEYAHFQERKEKAHHFCTEKVQYRNEKCGFSYNTISVKRMKTRRWSCSSKKNLNFNYKLLFLPEAMAEYVIVHELCHLQEMNHGPRFRQLVETIYGAEYKQYRKFR